MSAAQRSTAAASGRWWLRAARPTLPSERLVLGLLAQMPPEVRCRFDAAQVEALREAARRSQWGRHPLDIRLGLPLFAQRYYLVIVGGRERRSPERRRRDREEHPLLRPGHLALAALLATLALGIVGLAWGSAMG
jgi:hypothetical protein